MAFSCAHLSPNLSFLKDTSHIGLDPTLMISIRSHAEVLPDSITTYLLVGERNSTYGTSNYQSQDYISHMLKK